MVIASSLGALTHTAGAPLFNCGQSHMYPEQDGSSIIAHVAVIHSYEDLSRGRRHGQDARSNHEGGMTLVTCADKSDRRAMIRILEIGRPIELALVAARIPILVDLLMIARDAELAARGD